MSKIDIEREAFEKVFPVPMGVYWSADFEQYEARQMDSELDADEYHRMWQVWQAAHAHTNQPDSEQGGEWVSVDERQPDEFGEYLAATVARPHGWVIRYAPVGWICSEDYPVTHWMPMPQPPKSKEGES